MTAPPGPPGPDGYTLWAGTVGFTSPLAERFAAAAATGCREATLSPPDVLRAAGFGARVHLEFIPFTIVRTLRIAWDLVRAADRPNGGLVFDTWHFFRGEPDFEVLAGIPGDRIFQVQLDDAPAVPSGPLREETQRRLLPGDGALDLVAAIRALDRIGGLRRVGPEVISPDLAALPILDAATLAMDRTRAIVAAALADR